jgi:fatty acid amide hydrolase 2
LGLLDTSATRLAAMIRAGEISAVDLLETHIERIDSVNPVINAIAVRRYAAARDEAKAADRRLLEDDPSTLPPLFGVPCTIKEFLGVKGLPNTGGMHAYRARRAKRDAPVVARVRAAGAIIMATTNVPEGGLWLESDNPIYGLARNPYDPSRSPGGSSGGEGAIIAAGGSPFGLGADVGGSIRIPSGFCGIAGHKGTGGLIPSTGHFPSDPALARTLCLGPMARRVEDLVTLVPILAGPDGECDGAFEMPFGDPDSVNIRDLTIYKVHSPRGPRLWQPMREAMDKAADALGSMGARVQPLEIDAIADAVEIWAAKLATASDGYAGILGGHRRIKPVVELIRLLRGRSNHTAPALVMTLAEVATVLLPGRTKRMFELGEELREKIGDIMGPGGVLLYPPYTRPAPRHLMPLVTAFDGRCTPLFNVTEQPVTVVPVAFSGGLPVSLQIIGRRGDDHITLAVGAALERAFGGWVRAELPGQASR